MNEYLEKAKIAFEKNDYLEALNLYEKVKGEIKDEVQALLGMSECFYRLNRFDESIKKCQEVLAIEPNEAIAHVGLADAYEAIGDLKKSRDEGKLAFTMDPNSPWALGCYGRQLIEDKEIDEGIQLLEKAVNIDDSLYFNHVNLVVAYTLKKDHKKVLGKVKKLYSLRPSFRWGVGIAVAYMNRLHLYPIIGSIFFLTLLGFLTYHSWIFLIISVASIVLLLLTWILVKRYLR